MSTSFKVLVAVIISMCVIIPLAIGSHLAGPGSSSSGGDGGGYYGYDDYDDCGDAGGGVTILNIAGNIEVDSQASTVNVTLSHNGGDPIYWNEYQVTVGGMALAGYPTNPITDVVVDTTAVGESAMWTVANMAGMFVVGDQYTIKVIVIRDQNIAWQKDITAIAV